MFSRHTVTFVGHGVDWYGLSCALVVAAMLEVKVVYLAVQLQTPLL